MCRERGRVAVADAAKVTGANRNTIKDHLKALTRAGHIEQHGAGRGTWYSLTGVKNLKTSRKLKGKASVSEAQLVPGLSHAPRHADFQSNPPSPAGTYTPGQSGLIFSNSPQSGERATKGRMLLWSKPRGQYRYSNSVSSTFCRIGSFLLSRSTLASSFS